MFNLIKNIPDGRVMNFHVIYSQTIDLADKVLTAIIRSWPSEIECLNNFPSYLEFKVDIAFIEWDESKLLTLEQDVQILDWQYYNNEFVPPPPFDLAKAMADKQTEINTACKAQIYSGYDSDALGSIHHYPAKDQDQTNIIASVTDSYNPDNPSDWITPFWCQDGTGFWDYVDHTASQIRKAGSDGKLAIIAALGKNKLLQEAIAAATTQADLDAITW